LKPSKPPGCGCMGVDRITERVPELDLAQQSVE
jgi:hypothetical protein